MKKEKRHGVYQNIDTGLKVRWYEEKHAPDLNDLNPEEVKWVYHGECKIGQQIFKAEMTTVCKHGTTEALFESFRLWHKLAVNGQWMNVEAIALPGQWQLKRGAY
jgi:hypothetical protein